MNEKGTAGRHKPASTPPTAPTWVAPAFFMKSAAKASNTASTTINSLSIGEGTKTLVMNIIEPKSAVMNNLLAFCTEMPLFTYESCFSLKKLDV
jgi:hypothetical protein